MASAVMVASPVAAPIVAAPNDSTPVADAAPNDATPVADAALNDATPVADAFEAAFPMDAASVADTTVASAPTHCKDAVPKIGKKYFQKGNCVASAQFLHSLSS
jgi:hypothetical protein